MTAHDLRARLSALTSEADAEPPLVELLRSRATLIQILNSADLPVPDLRLPADLVRVRLAAGTPLLDGIDLPVPAAAGRLFEQIAAIFLADPSLAELVEPIMVAVRSHRLHVEQLVSEALVSHSDHLTTLARAASVDRTLLGLFADLTSRPLLAGIGGRLRPALRLGAWEQRYCPICGAHPLSGETVIPDSRLRCSRCATAWAWDLLRCPACEQGIMTSLNADLHVEGRSWTVSGCDDCRTYLKIAASGSSGSLGQLMADDLATWRLDRAAVASGYQPVRVSARRLEHGDLAGEELDDD